MAESGSNTVNTRGRTRRAVRALLRNALRIPLLRLERSLIATDEVTRTRLTRLLSDHAAMHELSFATAIPRDLTSMQGFEDCAWLYSSNPMNHGLSRLRLDEAAYLYRLVRSFDAPHAAELGRYRGGTSVLMAAAGAHVLSLDNGALPGQETFAPDLAGALTHLGLTQQVQVVQGDAFTHPVQPSSYDIVFLDCAYSYDAARSAFEHWWPAVMPGGALIFRDGKDTVLSDTARYVATLDLTTLEARRDQAPGAFVVLRRTNVTSDVRASSSALSAVG